MARQRIVVLKIGGEILRSQKLFENAMREIIRIKQRDPGTNLILVHGAGPQIDQQFQAANVAIKKKEGRRVTTEAGMDVIWNFIPAESKRVAQRLWSAGIRAESIDSSITTLARIRERNLGFVGTPIGVNLRQLHRVLRKGAIPIVSICGLTKQGQIVNVNADEVAANIAVAVRASRLELKTNVPGVMKDGRTVGRISVARANSLIGSGIATEGMLVKLRAARDAVERGVKQARISNTGPKSRGTTIRRRH